MQTSAEFRQQNHILFSAKILRDVQVKEDFSAGWGAPLATPVADVLDLNGNGQVDAVVDDGKDNFERNAQHTIVLNEPALHAPNMKQLAAYAASKGAQVLTQDDLPHAVFIADLSAHGGEEGPAVGAESNVRPIDVLVSEREPFTAGAKFAIDLSTSEFLIYTAN